MAVFGTQRSTLVLICALAVFITIGHQLSAGALEVGKPAPPFTLPSTTGGNISLEDFRGKKWVLLEFYAADFAPA